MTREEILAEIERLKPWFHSIELQRGIRTKNESVAGEPADHPFSTWQIIKDCLPKNLSGRSVLDVGCNAGFYAVEAKRRNAARVLGVDSSRHHIRQALFVRKVLGLDIAFRRLSVYDLSARDIGQFDVTLALGLIYHCKHIMLALEKLFHITKDTLIVETQTLPPDQFPSPLTHPLGGLYQTLYPLAYVENPPGSNEAVQNWFFPGPETAKALLKSVGFGKVSFFSVDNGRAVLVCSKGRARGGQSVSHMAARLDVESGDAVCRAGSGIRFQVRVENTGSAIWPASAEQGVQIKLGAHLVREDEEMIEWDYGRADLKRDLAPGEYDSLEIALQAPYEPGNYYVEFDMVAEHFTWFENLDSATARRPMSVRAH